MVARLLSSIRGERILTGEKERRSAGKTMPEGLLEQGKRGEAGYGAPPTNSTALGPTQKRRRGQGPQTEAAGIQTSGLS